MFKQLMYKWFGLDPRTCEACEILRVQLDESNVERRELLHRLLDKDKTEPLPVMKEEEMKPIGNQHIPWRVRQQMLEQEDRVKARLMKDRTEEISKLEQEMGLAGELERGPSGGLRAEIR